MLGKGLTLAKQSLFAVSVPPRTMQVPRQQPETEKPCRLKHREEQRRNRNSERDWKPGDKRRAGSAWGKIRGGQKPGEKNVADVGVGCGQWKGTGAGWDRTAQHSLLCFPLIRFGTNTINTSLSIHQISVKLTSKVFSDQSAHSNRLVLLQQLHCRPN